MEQRLVPGLVVEHAGQRWRVHRPLGPDAVLLRNNAGEITSVDPVHVRPPTAAPRDQSPAVQAELHCTDAQWAEAGRRRDRLVALARLPTRTVRDVDRAARELGLKRRRVRALLHLVNTGGRNVRLLLPRLGGPRAKRPAPAIDALITHRASIRLMVQAMSDHSMIPNGHSGFVRGGEVMLAQKVLTVVVAIGRADNAMNVLPRRLLGVGRKAG